MQAERKYIIIKEDTEKQLSFSHCQLGFLLLRMTHVDRNTATHYAGNLDVLKGATL